MSGLSAQQARDLAAKIQAHLLHALCALTPTGTVRVKGHRVQRVEDAIARLAEAGGHGAIIAEAQRSLQAAQALAWEMVVADGDLARTVGRARAYNGEAHDLESEAMIGMHRAALRFDPDRGASWRTHARWWIRSALSKVPEQHGHGIMVGRRGTQEVARLRKMTGLSDEQAAEELGTTSDRVRDLRSLLNVRVVDWTAPVVCGELREIVSGDRLEMEDRIDAARAFRTLGRT